MRAVRRIAVVIALVVLASAVGLQLVGARTDLSALPPRDHSVAVGDGLEVNVREHRDGITGRAGARPAVQHR